MSLFVDSELSPLPLVVADEVSKLAGVDVLVNSDQELLVVFKGTGELLHQLPHALQELIDDRRHLFGIASQVVAPGGEVARYSTILHYIIKIPGEICFNI